jgi:hypothetical protein
LVVHHFNGFLFRRQDCPTRWIFNYYRFWGGISSSGHGHYDRFGNSFWDRCSDDRFSDNLGDRFGNNLWNRFGNNLWDRFSRNWDDWSSRYDDFSVSTYGSDCNGCFLFFDGQDSVAFLIGFVVDAL